MTQRKPWFFPFMKRAEALFHDDQLDQTDLGYLYLLTQMNHAGQPKVLYGHVRIAERFRLSRERAGGRLAKYERLGLIRALHKPVSPGRHGGEGQMKQYALLWESGDGNVTPFAEESCDDGVTSLTCGKESCDGTCDGTCDGGVTPTRSLEGPEPPAGSSTVQEPPPAGLVPGHRQAMTSVFDTDAARRHFDALYDLLVGVPAPVQWRLGHHGQQARVPAGWDCIDLLAVATESLAASQSVTSVTGMLRKVLTSAQATGDPAESALLSLGAMWVEHQGGSAARVPICGSCSYPPSLCSCTQEEAAS